MKQRIKVKYYSYKLVQNIHFVFKIYFVITACTSLASVHVPQGGRIPSLGTSELKKLSVISLKFSTPIRIIL